MRKDMKIVISFNIEQHFSISFDEIYSFYFDAGPTHFGLTGHYPG